MVYCYRPMNGDEFEGKALEIQEGIYLLRLTVSVISRRWSLVSS